ncbi:hypothetical protein Q1695_010723 [Nippostrongylus brasiliensis]|nr:hypothetical protein Q1695_010723 [Nippostrongylus brasiliensis]
MLGRIQFGPRLECFGDSSGPPFTIVSPEKKLLAAKRGQFTIFDDEPVEIPPSHPLGRERSQHKLSELWTRKDEDIDWKSLECSGTSVSSIKFNSKRQMAEPRSLEELTSIRMSQDWIAVAEEGLQLHSRKNSMKSLTASTTSTKTAALPNRVTSNSSYCSCTGRQDSRISFAPHDLTGPALGVYRESELMRYMDVDNLDFDKAREYAPAFNVQSYKGTIKNGVFSAKSLKDQESAEERILPHARRVSQTRHRASTTSPLRMNGTLNYQLGSMRDLAYQLTISRSEMERLTLDSYATLQSADRMIRRADEWFEMMLDDLERRIEDEQVLTARHDHLVNKKIAPILRKLHDLTTLYQTLNSLDKKTSMNDQTMRTAKRNVEIAEESIAKLASNDARLKAASVVEKNFVLIAAEISSNFYNFERTLLELLPFTFTSTAAMELIETIISQMNGIHQTIMRSINFVVIHGQNRRPYGLDPWSPTETTSEILSDDTTVILSAHSSTEPLSAYHESARSKSFSDNCSSCREALKLRGEESKNNAGALNSDRPPSAVGATEDSSSDGKEQITFDSAKIFHNPRKYEAVSTSSSISSPWSSAVPFTENTVPTAKKASEVDRAKTLLSVNKKTMEEKKEGTARSKSASSPKLRTSTLKSNGRKSRTKIIVNEGLLSGSSQAIGSQESLSGERLKADVNRAR